MKTLIECFVKILVDFCQENSAYTTHRLLKYMCGINLACAVLNAPSGPTGCSPCGSSLGTSVCDRAIFGLHTSA